MNPELKEAAKSNVSPLKNEATPVLLKSESELQTSSYQESSNIIEYKGHTVIEGPDYDLSRKICIGNARNHDVEETVTVGEAVHFPTTSEAEKCVTWARRKQKEIAEKLEHALEKCLATSQLIIDRHESIFSRLAYDSHKDLTSALTKVWQDSRLAEKSSWDDPATLEKVRATLLDLAWRFAKQLYLPAFCWTGTFSLRNNSNILTTSGLMCVDFDHIGVDVDAFMARLKNDRLIFAAQRSPSLTGVKVQVRIPDDSATNPKKFLACFETFERYVASEYPNATLKVDKQAKAIGQLCFFMYDPESFYFTDSYVLLPDEDILAAHMDGAKVKRTPSAATPLKPGKPKSAQKPKSKFAFDTYEPQKQWQVIRSAVESLIPWLADLPSGQGERNSAWTRIGYSFRSWFDELDEQTIRDEAAEWLIELASEHYTGSEGCVRRAMDSNNDGRCGLGTLFHLAKEHGNWQPPWRSADRDEEKSVIIVLPSGNISISESARAIFELVAPSHTMFNRGGVIVEVRYDRDGDAFLDPLKPEAFRTRVERFGILRAWRSDNQGESNLKPAKMAVDDAKAMLLSLEARELLPSISSLLRCSVITENVNGDLVVLGKGYHAELGGMLILQGDEVPDVALKDAVETLLGLAAEFTFQTPGDKSRNLAARITPALRMGGFIPGNVPLDVMEADDSQAGKGYSHQITASIYNEVACLVAQRKGGVGSTDESFGSAIASGRPFIALDNIRDRLDSPFIESFITCPGLFPARIPGGLTVRVDPRRITLQLTSNGMESTPDLAKRSSICRIIKRPGHKFRNIPALIREDPSLLLGCVMAVIREWHRRGKPRTEEMRHDFHDWCQTLDWIVQNILGCAPLMDGHQEAQRRVCSPVLSWLRKLVLEVEEQNKLDEPLRASDIVSLTLGANISLPCRVHGDERAAAKVVGGLMKKEFGENERITVEGFVIEREKEDYKKPSGDWGTANSYKIMRSKSILE